MADRRRLRITGETLSEGKGRRGACRLAGFWGSAAASLLSLTLVLSCASARDGGGAVAEKPSGTVSSSGTKTPAEEEKAVEEGEDSGESEGGKYLLWAGDKGLRSLVEESLPADMSLVEANPQAAGMIQGVRAPGLDGQIPEGWEPAAFSFWEYPEPVETLVRGAEGRKGAGAEGYAPLEWSVWGFFYNREVFSQLGLNAPSTWKGFTDSLETLRIRGYTPVTAAGADPRAASAWFYYLSLRLGGVESHRRLMRGDMAFSDSHVRLVFNHWRHMIRTYFDSAAGELSPGEAWQKVADGEAGMLLGGSAQLGRLSEEERKELGFFAFPGRAGRGDDQAGVATLGRGLRFLQRSAKGEEGLREGVGALFAEPARRVLGEIQKEGAQGLFFPRTDDSSVTPETAPLGEEPALGEDFYALGGGEYGLVHLPALELPPRAAEELARICRGFLQRRFQVQGDLSRVENFR